MTITKQRMDVLKIIKDNLQGKGEANTIKQIYEEKIEKIGNVHEVLTRLMEDGYVVRQDKNYVLTNKGKLLFEGKEEAKEVPIEFSEEEIKQFQELAKDKDLLQRLAEQLNPNLMGLLKERLACILAMVSDDDKNQRNRLHILYTGDPGCGKSSIMSWAARNLWGFFADSDSTKSALKGSAKGFQIKEGLLTIADNSTLFIDELDKMELEDQTGLLAAMEQGMIVMNKDGVKNKQMNARIRCIATCNNEQRIRTELRDRFDLTFDIKNLTQEEKEKLIRIKINNWDRDEDMIDCEFLKKYLKYAKRFKTKLPEDRERFMNILIEELATGKLQGEEIRSIESVIRITKAVAKIRLHEEIIEDDIKIALGMIK